VLQRALTADEYDVIVVSAVRRLALRATLSRLSYAEPLAITGI
jgi:hypothetical protein